MNFDRFECLSFDCYGTLIDWESGLSSSLGKILTAHQITVSRETVLESFGKAEAEVESGPFRPYREVLKAALIRMGDALAFQPSRDELERFSTSVMDWPSFPDSPQALRALATSYRLVILSNIDDDLFEGSKKRLEVDFDHVFTAQRIGSYKPSHRNFEYLIEHAGVPKDKILHVAQSLYHDIAPARETGLSTAWIHRRHGLDGFGATPAAKARPDLTAPDLQTFAALALTSS